jgi:hypothetical protein
LIRHFVEGVFFLAQHVSRLAISLSTSRPQLVSLAVLQGRSAGVWKIYRTLVLAPDYFYFYS